MNLILFIAILITSFIVVRIGAIAFQLTGLEWSIAQFQALSCFTSTGFTTKESELITTNIRRRRIASVLMVLGNAGLVTLIATFANTLRPSGDMAVFTVPIFGLTLSSGFLPWINITVIGISIFIVNRVFTKTRLGAKLTRVLRTRVMKQSRLKSLSVEELLVSTGGYGVSNMEITDESPILDKTILETNLRKEDITILVVERGRETIPNPPASTKILLGDRLVCFGKLDTIRKKLVKGDLPEGEAL